MAKAEFNGCKDNLSVKNIQAGIDGLLEVLKNKEEEISSGKGESPDVSVAKADDWEVGDLVQALRSGELEKFLDENVMKIEASSSSPEKEVKREAQPLAKQGLSVKNIQAGIDNLLEILDKEKEKEDLGEVYNADAGDTYGCVSKETADWCVGELVQALRGGRLTEFFEAKGLSRELVGETDGERASDKETESGGQSRIDDLLKGLAMFGQISP